MRKKVKPKRIAALLTVLIGMCGGGLVGFTYWEEKQQLAERDRAEQEARAAIERRHSDELSHILDTVRLVADHAVHRQEINPRNAQLLRLVTATRSKYIVFPPSALMARPNLDITARISIARQLARMISILACITDEDVSHKLLSTSVDLTIRSCYSFTRLASHDKGSCL